MVIEVNPQHQNADLPIEVTELGMETEVKPWQYINAEFPMEVTELGMETEDRFPQP